MHRNLITTLYTTVVNYFVPLSNNFFVVSLPLIIAQVISVIRVYNLYSLARLWFDLKLVVRMSDKLLCCFVFSCLLWMDRAGCTVINSLYFKTIIPVIIMCEHCVIQLRYNLFPFCVVVQYWCENRWKRLFSFT